MHDRLPPLVLIPGIQGRWEYVRPTVQALSPSFRVITFSIAGGDLLAAVEQTRQALDDAGAERAVVCGISFGGVVALRFAAAHPERTSALVLASTPGPSWHLSARHERYARLPWLFGPLFLIETPLRLRAEVRVAMRSPLERWRFALAQLRTLCSAPVSFARIADRARAIERSDRAADAARVTAPTLIVTGEPGLDHVVPADGTAEYAALIRGARQVTLAGTGHLGWVTKPAEFAALVRAFAQDHQHAPA